MTANPPKTITSVSTGNVHKLMNSLIGDKEYSVDTWLGTTYGKIKIITPTEKGNLGEDLLKELLTIMGYANVELQNSRRGQWDVRAQNNGKDIKFEVKVATQDINKSHQFNGVRHDTNYTHLFLLAVLPEELRYKIIAKKDRDNYTMTPMQKKTASTYKMTFRSSDLETFGSFKKEIKKLLGNP